MEEGIELSGQMHLKGKKPRKGNRTVFDIGTRVMIHILRRDPEGNVQYVDIPGKIDSPISTVPVTLPNGKKIMSMQAMVLSLRTTNPDGDNPGVQYLTITPETVRFLTLRSEAVVGLDVDENGRPLTRQQLEEQRARDIQSLQERRAAQSGPATVAVAALFDQLAEAIGPANS